MTTVRRLLTRREALAAPVLAGAKAAPPARPPVAFHYAAVFSPAERDWYGRFEVLVVGGILAEEQSRRLRERGPRLVAYEWSSAFYPGDAVSASPAWQAKVTANAAGWLLNREPVGGGAAEPGKAALWYNFASAALREARVEHLAAVLNASGYDGLFFDTLGFEQLPPRLRALFSSRHPNENYDACQGEFFRLLRRRLGRTKIIFLNQGYRKAKLWLPYADYDLTESYFTALDNRGGTRFRNWHSAQAPWEAIRTPMEQLIMPAARAYPGVRFVHLNYAAGARAVIQRAVEFSFAAARLFDQAAYLVAPDSPDAEVSTVYARDLGPALEPGYQQDPGGLVAWRRFRNGTVVLKTGEAPFPGRGPIRELPSAPGGYIL